MKFTNRKKIIYLISSIIFISAFIVCKPINADMIDEEELIKISNEIQKNINLGTGGISNPISTSGNPTRWTGSKVYYGNEGMLWRVLDESGFLFADDCIEYNVFYNYSFINATWETCTLRAYLNGYTYYGGKYDQDVMIDYTNDNYKDNLFTRSEYLAIKESYISTKDADNGFEGGNDTIDKLFLLSLEEVQNSKYGFVNNATRGAGEGAVITGWWWLRSVGTRSRAYAAIVGADGAPITAGANVHYGYLDGNKGLRPAFNLDTSKVLFTSYADSSKESYATFGSDESFVKADKADENVWKLTLKESGKSLEAMTTDDTEFIEGRDMVINVTHQRGWILSDATQISAMLVDSNGVILYYGKINDDLIATESVITLPKGLNSGKYTLKIFAESINDNYITDYATEFSDISITIDKEILVEDIVDMPDEITVGDDIELMGCIKPNDSTYKEIVFTIKDAGVTGATIDNNRLLTSETGTITIIATIKDGLGLGNDFVKEFTIEVVEVEQNPIEPPVDPNPGVPDIEPNDPTPEAPGQEPSIPPTNDNEGSLEGDASKPPVEDKPGHGDIEKPSIGGSSDTLGGEGNEVIVEDKVESSEIEKDEDILETDNNDLITKPGIPVLEYMGEDNIVTELNNTILGNNKDYLSESEKESVSNNDIDNNDTLINTDSEEMINGNENGASSHKQSVIESITEFLKKKIWWWLILLIILLFSEKHWRNKRKKRLNN